MKTIIEIAKECGATVVEESDSRLTKGKIIFDNEAPLTALCEAYHKQKLEGAVADMQGDSEPYGWLLDYKNKISFYCNKHPEATFSDGFLELYKNDLTAIFTRPGNLKVPNDADRVKVVSDSTLVDDLDTVLRWADKIFMSSGDKDKTDRLALGLRDLVVAIKSQLSTNADGWVSVGDRLPVPYVPNDDKDAQDAAKYRAINTPEIQDFIKAIELEALHQRDRWGAESDAGKTDADWFWLIGYLAGKAVNKPEKALHHIITTAAACLNWHGAKSGNYKNMRPGINASPKPKVK